MKLAHIKWFDASYQRGECTADELFSEVYLHSAGILVRETETVVTLAIDRYDNDETWRYISHIPKVNIVEIQTFDVKE